MATEGLGEVACECDKVAKAAHGMAVLVEVGAADAGDKVGDIAGRRSGDERGGGRLGFSGSKTTRRAYSEAMTRADLGNVEEGKEAEHGEETTTVEGSTEAGREEQAVASRVAQARSAETGAWHHPPYRLSRAGAAHARSTEAEAWCTHCGRPPFSLIE